MGSSTETEIDCPQCARHHTDSVTFCECGSFLGFVAYSGQSEVEEIAPVRFPKEEVRVIPDPEPIVEARIDLTTTSEVPVVKVNAPTCTNGHGIHAGRTLCQVCGMPAAGQSLKRRPAPVPVRRVELRPAVPPWYTKLPLVPIAAIVVACVIGLLAWRLWPDGDPAPLAADRPIVEATLDPSTVTALVSSQLPDAGSITYGAPNLLDSDPATAWNNNSAVAGPGSGERITFVFDQPVELLRVEIANGYGKDEARFSSNNRVNGLSVTTDIGTFETVLADTPDSQSILGNFGLTTTLILDITSIYPGTGFDSPTLTADLAVSEVGFVINELGSPTTVGVGG